MGLRAGPVAGDVLIAVAGPAHGPGAARTAAIKSAADRASARLAAQGGIGGEAVRVITEDDACSGPGGDAAARRIAAQKPALVLGHPCAAAAVAAAKVYGPARILYIATATRHPALTMRRAGPAIFRLDGRDDRQGTFAAAALLRLHPASRFALVSDRTAYARRIVTSARASLLAAGAPDPAMLTLVAGDKDYGRLVGDLAKSAADAVLFAGFPIEAAIVLRQMRSAGVKADFIGCDATATREFLDAAGEAGANARFIVPFDSTGTAPGMPSTSPTPADGTPEDLAARRTDVAIDGWVAAIKASGSVDGAAAALQAGAPGVPSFDAAGDALLPSFELVGSGSIAASKAIER